MALPPSLATRTIHGAWVKTDGTPESGTVLYTTTGYTRFPADNVVMSPARFLGTMNGSGEVTITNVPVNDDPDGDPAVGGYLETVTYSDGRVTSRVIIISVLDPATVEVADKPAASVAVPLAQYATLDGTGNVPFSQLGNIPAGSNDPATGGTYGTVILAGDLSGVASAPTVVGLATAISDIASLSSAVSSKAEDSAVVHLTGAETVAGVKTFSASPIVPTPTTSFQAATKGYADSVGGTVPDADATTKGKLQLTGALGGTAASPTTPTAVHLTGAETVAGVKTFSSSPIVPTPSSGTDAANKTYADTKATDSLAVHLAGTETLTGAKTFSAAMTINATVARNNTDTFTAPNDTTASTVINQSNTVVSGTSADLFQINYKAARAGWFNEWGGLRVRVPSSANLGYADVAAKLFEPSSGGEDGLQVFGPGGTKKMYVRDGALSTTSLATTADAAISGNLTVTGTSGFTGAVTVPAPSTGSHPTTKTYVDGLDAADVKLTGAQTVAGVKTFSSLPTIPATPSASTDAASKGYTDGLDAANVKLTGAQTVAGIKTFSSLPVVPLTPSATTDAASKGYADTKATASQHGPNNYGYLSWNFAPTGVGSSNSLATAGTLRVTRVTLAADATVTNIHMMAGAPGVSLTSGQNFAALYTAAGALLSTTADQTTAWTVAGANLYTMALGAPQAVAAGDYYVAVFFNGTSSPTFSRATSTTPGIANGLVSAANSLHATTSDTGRTTTMPATLGTKTASTSAHWVGLS